jgi:2'-5' RNA ligase superfamily protein
MPFAIELFFDAATDAAVRRVWAALAEQGIAPYLHESAAQPHISLAVYEGLDVSGWGVFPGASESAVFAAPVVTSDLLAVHDEACALLASVAREPAAYYLPGRWVPHCSLAVHFPEEPTDRAIAVCHQLPLPLGGHIEAIGAAETRPTRLLFSIALGPAAR